MIIDYLIKQESLEDGDRILIQCFMNLVILTVIFLLWLNNPVQTKLATD